jgi:hypothetical protein
MVKPSLFNLTTDYASLANDAGTTVSIISPGGAIIAGASFATYNFDTVIGKQASLNRIQISSSKNSNIRYSTQTLAYSRSGSPGPYTVLAYAFRTSPSTLRCRVYIQNPYIDTLTTEAGNETFTFHIDTFIPPFT